MCVQVNFHLRYFSESLHIFDIKILKKILKMFYEMYFVKNL